MKAHIPAKQRLPKAAREAVREFHDELEAETFRRWIKLTCVILHNRFGFGHDRLAVFLGEINEAANSERQDEIFWRHIDQVVNQELKLDFEPEKYEELED